MARTGLELLELSAHYGLDVKRPPNLMFPIAAMSRGGHVGGDWVIRALTLSTDESTDEFVT
jgi:hypothetical protein